MSKSQILAGKILPCPVKSGQLTVIGISGTDIIPGIIRRKAEILFSFRTHLDRNVDRVIRHPVRLMGGHDDLHVRFGFHLLLVAAEHGERHRLEDDLHIEPERPVVYVPEIQFYTLSYAGIAPVPMYLSPAGHAGLHLMLDHVERNRLAELIDKMRKLRSRSHDTHLAFQNIEKLRKFIEGCTPHEDAQFRSPVVPRFSPGRISPVIYHHRPEFQHLKLPLLVSDAHLLKQNRSRGRDFDRDRQNQHDRAGYNYTEKAYDNVCSPLDGSPSELFKAVRPHIDQFAAADIFKFRVGGNHIIVKRNDKKLHAVFLTCPDVVGNKLVLIRLESNDHFGHIVILEICSQIIGRVQDLIDLNSQFRFIRHIFSILRRQPAGSHQYLMLNIISAAPQMIQNHAGEYLLKAKQEQCQHIEYQNDTAGHIFDLENENQSRHNKY